MNEFHFENAFPSVPAAVHLRLEKALEEKNMNLNKAKRPVATLAIVLALLLGLTGMAYAATQTGILEYLVGSEEKASEDLKGSVQTVTAEAFGDNIQIDLTGAIFDGDRLALSFTAENKMPGEIALVTLDTVTLNGKWVPINFQSFQEQWLPDVFTVDVAPVVRNPISGGMLSGVLEEDYTGIVQGEATFVVSRPVKEMVVVDPWMWYDMEAVIPDAEWRRDYEDRKGAIEQSGMEIADVFTMEAGYWLQEGYTPVNVSGHFLLDRAEYSELAPFYAGPGYGERPNFSNVTNRAGQMQVTERITLSFTIDAEAAKASRIEPELEDIPLENGTVHFEKVAITPLSTLIEIRIYPKENTQKAKNALMDCYGAAWLCNANGEPIDYMDMEGEGWKGYREEAGGENYLVIETSWGGMKTLPDALGFSFPDAPETEDADVKRMRQEFTEKVVIPLK